MRHFHLLVCRGLKITQQQTLYQIPIAYVIKLRYPLQIRNIVSLTSLSYCPEPFSAQTTSPAAQNFLDQLPPLKCIVKMSELYNQKFHVEISE